MSDLSIANIGGKSYNLKDKAARAINVYATCNTAAATAEKVVTTTNSDFILYAGVEVVIKFSNTNTASNPTLNVNGTGAKSVWYNTALITTSSLGYAGTANRPMKFTYDGTQWVFIGWSYDADTSYSPVKLGFGTATCSTAAATAAKEVTISSYKLVAGGIVSIQFTNAITVASATLNISSKGAKPIYYNGAALAANVVKAGDIVTMQYNGSQYVIISIERYIPVITTAEIDELLAD